MSASDSAPLEKLCETPRIFKMDNFARADEFAPILDIVRDPAQLAQRGVKTQHNKAGLSFEWKVASEPILKTLVERTYARLGFDNDLGFTLRFRNYQLDEYHPGHLDVYQVENVFLVATAILYLNDTTRGGETFFPRAQPESISIAPQAGRLAIWFNYTPAGDPDPLAFHEALPVQSGEKLTLTNFIYKPIEFSATNLLRT